MAGLRARKKEHVRATIQKEALRLFTDHGYEHTTVEQIAEAAGVSPATVYRYYKSKEDLVVTDEYDPVIVQSLLNRPADEPLIESVRAVMTGVLVEYFDRDRELIAARHALRLVTPSLQVAFYEEQERTLELFSALVARHLRRPANDVDVRIASGAVSGAMQAAMGLWFEQGAKGGRERIRELLNHAIDRIASALTF
ncbi:MAG TPA: TetR/AcrR family transcriptional regulator [Candidatus Acidoferrales bacterium]|nr:TetR/AcrR family transcriptional regulator [Candidatus Acidoferrales bacterium]